MASRRPRRSGRECARLACRSCSTMARSCARSLWIGVGSCYPARPKATRDGIQVSEAITGDGAAVFRHACWMDLEGIVSKRIGSR